MRQRESGFTPYGPVQTAIILAALTITPAFQVLSKFFRANEGSPPTAVVPEGPVNPNDQFVLSELVFGNQERIATLSQFLDERDIRATVVPKDGENLFRLVDQMTIGTVIISEDTGCDDILAIPEFEARRLIISNREFSEEELAGLKRITGLQLMMLGGNFNGEVLRVICESNPDLREVSLECPTGFDFSSLKALPPGLEFLHISSGEFGIKDFKSLPDFPKLKRLNVSDTQLPSQEALSRLLEDSGFLRALREFRLPYEKDPNGVNHLPKLYRERPNLEILGLYSQPTWE